MAPMAPTIRELVESRARAAREAARALALASARTKSDALLQMARGLEEKADAIRRANRMYLERARGEGHPRAFLDRLTLTDARIEEMAAGVRQVAALPDPVGETVRMWRRPNGMEVGRVRVPLGVIGFIYESRPNVTADAAALCVKSGNACVLRGGREALESNALIVAILAKGLEKAGLPPEALGFIDVADRQAVEVLLTLDRGWTSSCPAAAKTSCGWWPSARPSRCQARQGSLSRLRRRQRRPRDGDRDRGQCQGPAPLRVQRDGDAAGPPGGRRRVPARRRRPAA